MPNLKLLVADSAALTNTATATVMLNTAGASYECVFPAKSLPVDTARGCVLRVSAAVHVTASHTTDTLATVLQVGKTGTMTTVAATSAHDAVDDDIHHLTADIVLRSKTAFASRGVGVYTGLTAPQSTLNKSTTWDWASDFRVQVKNTWSVADTGNSCKVLWLSAEVLDVVPGSTAALT